MPTTPPSTFTHALAAGARGAATAVAALGAAEVAAWATGADSPVDDAARIAVDLSPQVVVEETVRRFGTADKPVVRLAVGASVAAALAGSLALEQPGGTGRARRLGPVAALVVLDAYAARRRAPRRTPLAHLAVAGSAAAATLRARGASPGGSVAAGVLGAAALTVTHRVREARVAARTRQLTTEPPLVADEPLPPLDDGAHDWPGVEPLPSPAARWFVTDVNLRPPLVTRDTWRLTVTGHVDDELVLDDAALRALGTVEADVAVVCIHTRPGWLRQASPRVTGVPVSRVLEAAGVRPGAVDVRSVAVDGFAARHGVAQLLQSDALVVLGVDGHRLTPAHGAPARLLVPGLYGQYAGVKWLTRLEVADHRASFYWESRGWPVAVQGIRPSSRVDAVAGHRVPVGPDGRTRSGAAGTLDVDAGDVVVTGGAWAPAHGGVAQVEVSLDDEPWSPAELAGETSPHAQRRWRHPLVLTPGTHELRVRVRAADGTAQVEHRSPPGFTGSTGLHRLRLHAR